MKSEILKMVGMETEEIEMDSNDLMTTEVLVERIKSRKGLWYYPDIANSPVLDTRFETPSDDDIKYFIENTDDMTQYPECFIPEEGVKYAKLSNIGEGSGYGDETYFVPLDQLEVY